MAGQAKQGATTGLSVETIGDRIGVERFRAVPGIRQCRRIAVPQGGAISSIGAMGGVTEHADFSLVGRLDCVAAVDGEIVLGRRDVRSSRLDDAGCRH